MRNVTSVIRYASNLRVVGRYVTMVIRNVSFLDVVCGKRVVETVSGSFHFGPPLCVVDSVSSKHPSLSFIIKNSLNHRQTCALLWIH